jgi:hypothetical protein
MLFFLLNFQEFLLIAGEWEDLYLLVEETLLTLLSVLYFDMIISDYKHHHLIVSKRHTVETICLCRSNTRFLTPGLLASWQCTSYNTFFVVI